MKNKPTNSSFSKGNLFINKPLLSHLVIIRLTLSFILIVLISCTPSTRCHSWNTINFNKIEKSLLTSPIKKTQPLYKYLKKPKRKTIQGINKTPLKREIFMLFLDNNIKAVFKPGRDFGSSIKSAYMAYRLSQFMDLKLVPPTVIRTVKGETGIVQLFIDHLTAKQIDPVKNLTASQKSKIYIFSFILGEHNLHPGNLLLGKKCNQPALIDNESAFWPAVFKYEDYPFIPYTKSMDHIRSGSFIKLKEFPENKLISINADAIFSNMELSHDKKTLIKRHFSWFYGPEELVNNTLFFIDDWKGAIWIKKNFRAYTYLYKQFLPTIIPKALVKKLKKLSYEDLSLLIFPLNIREDVVSEMLARRDIILKEISNCASQFKSLICQAPLPEIQ